MFSKIFNTELNSQETVLNNIENQYMYPAFEEMMKAGEKRNKVSREIRLTKAAIVLTFLIAIPSVAYILTILIEQIMTDLFIQSFQQVLFLTVASLLSYGTFVYQFTRLGYLKRLLSSKTASDDEISLIYTEDDIPAITVLVPSYREDSYIVRKTLISAALQEYPNLRVVLLIDDPPYSKDLSIIRDLSASRKLPEELGSLLLEPRTKCDAAMEAFLLRKNTGQFEFIFESQKLGELYRYVATWFDEQAKAYPKKDHTDRFFIELSFRGPARHFHQKAEQWLHLAELGTGKRTSDNFLCEYKRLTSIFHVEFSSFERKRYQNLSHQPNKAMNINSYIALMGQSFREILQDGSFLIQSCEPFDAELTIPDAEFLLILDADTLLSPEYALRMVHCMRQPGNERLAIAQSPYSTFPDSSQIVQRIAGAQTDIQYIVHQGLSYYDATYWVGANALVRTAALRDIVTRDKERGYDILKFISDRTLIEDTESSIDLINRSWKIYNYPQRLAFSETPSDFGSLIVQRRRWANGGLLIIPKLLRYLWRKRAGKWSLVETVMRLHYLVALGPVSIALLILLVASFMKNKQAGWLLVIGLLYYALYARDLHLNNYRWYDIFRVLALNLLLIPVNLGGMFLSIYQACTGYKAGFGRTPRKTNRTPIHWGYLIAQYTFLLLLVGQTVLYFLHDYRGYSMFLLWHATFLIYAIGTFIGWRDSFLDIVFARWKHGK